MSSKRLNLTFEELPPAIRRQLASSRVADFLTNLDERLGLTGARYGVLALLVFEVCTLAVDPRDFVSEIALRLKISDTAAKIIAQAIEKEIFHPVENEMQNDLGIDLSLLHFGRELGPLPRLDRALAPSFAPSYAKATEDEKASEGKAARISSNYFISTPSLERRIQVEAPPDASSLRPEISRGNPSTLRQAQGKLGPRTNGNDFSPDTKQMPEGPVILHEEKAAVAPIQSQAPRPTFSIKIPIGQKKYYSTPAPVTARVEIPSYAPQSGATEGRPFSAPSYAKAAEGEKTMEGGPFFAPAKPTENKSSDTRIEPSAPPPLRPLSEISPSFASSYAKATEDEKASEGKPTVPTAPVKKLEPATAPAITNAASGQKDGPTIQRVVHYSEFYTQIKKS